MTLAAEFPVPIKRHRASRWQPWQLVLHLVSREFRLRYRRALLGWLWALLLPLMKFGVMALVFSKVLSVKVENFPAYLFSGVVFVGLFSAGVTNATSCIVNRANLTMRAGIPRWTIPTVSVLTDALDLVVAIPVLLAIAIVTGVGLGPWLIVLPLVLIVLIVLTLGVSLLLCTWNVFYRDIKVLVEVLMLLVFYLTPVFYDPKVLPPNYRRIIELNPMAIILAAGRNVTIYGRSPDWGKFIPAGAFSVLVLGIGWLVFQSKSASFGDEL